MYLVLSLSVTSFNEVIEYVWETRARQLKHRIKEKFEAEGEAVLGDPLIKALSLNDRPSYIPSDLFAEAMTNRMSKILDGAIELKGKNLSLVEYRTKLEEVIKASGFKLQEYALSIVGGAEGTGEQLVKNVEVRVAKHYDDVMARASGTFTRTVKRNSAIAAILVVVLANADTIYITNQLLADKSLRSSLAEIARDVSKNEEDPGAYTELQDLDLSTKQDLIEKAASTLPLGWNCDENAVDVGWPNAACTFRDFDSSKWNEALGILVGWGLTVLAIMLGAPFWFGLLQRIVNIRAVGVKPEPKPKDKGEKAG
jgi:hypothetical protein